jgi:hypothetical protein
MASIWLHEAGEKTPRKKVGHLSDNSAITVFKQMIDSWKGPKVQVFDYEYLLYSTAERQKAGKPAGGLYIEFCSPPSAPEKGQPHAKERKAEK